RAADSFGDGVWLVELGALVDPELVPHQVASVLGISERPGRPPAGTIVEALRSEELLVVLDNCEHLVDACARLSDLVLSTCANVRILATSREALKVTGEVTWWVPSLQVPDARAGLSLGQLARHSAVELFLERARAVQPGFKLTTDDAPYVIRICNELDGLPLAIE